MSWSTRLAFFFVLAFLLFTFSGPYAGAWKRVLSGSIATGGNPNSPGGGLPALPALPTLGSPAIN